MIITHRIIKFLLPFGMPESLFITFSLLISNIINLSVEKAVFSFQIS
jgi:hypothetical protein